jgi:putative PIN family toxin of toxin-antitoxin system
VRVVIDTNVLVSALISPGRTAWQVTEAVRDGRLTPLHDERILAEYGDVLTRPAFGFAVDDVAELVDLFLRFGETISAEPLELVVPDPDDLVFVEVAVTGRADAIVTGNRRHFPDTQNVPVWSPREVLEQLEGVPH